MRFLPASFPSYFAQILNPPSLSHVHSTPDLTKLSKKDPFEGPEYGPGEKVMELNSSDGSSYALVHNMYALMRGEPS